MTRRRILILGAAGRDFHDFNVLYRQDPTAEVIGFTATQIPGIAGRRYPPELSGPLYPDGLPIYDEAELEALIREHGVHQVMLGYSDLSYDHVGHLASRVVAAGAEFIVPGTRPTLLESPVPVVAVTAVRTGCGKSPLSRWIAALLRADGHRVVVVRHPMPYGDLAKQAVQRFATLDELTAAECTYEEREEYEQHIAEGSVVYAGVDYGAILEQAAAEAGVLLWDGGNNDWPFFRPDLWITVADALRPGHETSYYPGEVNLRAADLIVVNKVDQAAPADADAVEAASRAANPDAAIVRAASPLGVDGDLDLSGLRVLCVEDGPTLTHGGMAYGAAGVAALAAGATPVDARPYAVGPIREAFEAYPHIGAALPAVGYYPEQVAALEATIRATPCDAVLIGTPFDLGAHLSVDQPLVRVSYRFEPEDSGLVERMIRAAVQ